MPGAGGSGHHGIFLTRPATNGREDEGVFEEVFSFKVGEDPFVEYVGGDKSAVFGIIFMKLLFLGTDDEAGGEKFGIESAGEADALSVFAGHRETKNVDGAGTEPGFDGCKFVVHIVIIAYVSDGFCVEDDAWLFCSEDGAWHY